MPKKTPPPVGSRHGRLVVEGTERRPRGKQVSTYLVCRCDCGEFRSVEFRHWERIQSCGCLQKERASETHGKHGRATTRLYKVWTGMKQRCNNPNRKEYPNYGGRGIFVCAEWDDFSEFARWAEESGYSDELDIDRIDNDGPYSPGNCRWVTRKENLRHNRRSRQLTALGETKSLIAWSEDPRCEVSYDALSSRINAHGWDPEDAILTPKGRWNPKRKASS